MRLAKEEDATPYVAFEDAARARASAGSCWQACWHSLCRCCGAREPSWRLIMLNAPQPCCTRYPRNRVENTKYGLLSFVPKVLLEQFRYFFNLYFLLVALSQFVPMFEIGLRFTYIAPLVFVLAVTMAKEAYDDVQRWRMDMQLNNERYERLLPGGGAASVRAQDLRVGDVVHVNTNQRIPADLVLLRTPTEGGVVFVRTDGLDGETDWKLRLAPPCTQRLGSDRALSEAVASVHAAPPSADIYEFVGELTLYDDALEGGRVHEPLSLENTLWANTVLASCGCHALVVHTGVETRAAMNVAGAPPSKMASLDLQVNFMTKLLFVLVNLSVRTRGATAVDERLPTASEIALARSSQPGRASPLQPHRPRGRRLTVTFVCVRVCVCGTLRSRGWLAGAADGDGPRGSGVGGVVGRGVSAWRLGGHWLAVLVSAGGACKRGVAAVAAGARRLCVLCVALLPDHPDLSARGARHGQAHVQAADDLGREAARAARALVDAARGARWHRVPADGQDGHAHAQRDDLSAALTGSRHHHRWEAPRGQGGARRRIRTTGRMHLRLRARGSHTHRCLGRHTLWGGHILWRQRIFWR